MAGSLHSRRLGRSSGAVFAALAIVATCADANSVPAAAPSVQSEALDLVRHAFPLPLGVEAPIGPLDARSGSATPATEQNAFPTRLAGILPVTPGRILDTREGLGAPRSKVGPSSSIDVSVLGMHGVPASGVDAVALNITVVGATTGSFVTVWPTGVPRPETSSLNMTAGATIANLVVTKVGAGGMVSLFNRFGSTHIVADIVGYSTESAHLQSLVPSRILDTRAGIGAPKEAVGEARSIDVVVVGRGGVPEQGVGSVLINLTVAAPTAESYVTVWPTGSTRPEASSINMSAGETRPNMVVAKVGTDGKISLFNRFGRTQLIADVVGWMPDNGAYTAINPTRILDTRNGTGIYGTRFFIPEPPGYVLRPAFGDALGPGETFAVAVDESIVPHDASALMINLTAVGATEPTYVTSWPFGGDRPTASSLNVTPGDVVPNMIVVERGGEDEWHFVNRRPYFNLYNAFGRVHLIADVVGYFVPWNAQDDLDPIENTIHVVVAAPSDVGLSIDDASARHAVTVAEEWLRDQTGKGLRFDTTDGQIEVSRLQFARTQRDMQDQINGSDGFDLDGVFDAIVAGGFASDRKKFVVLVEGLSGYRVKGIGGGSTAVTFEPELDTSLTWESSIEPAVLLHELFHTFDAVSYCSPSHDSSHSGHVLDERDLMYWQMGFPTPTVLDAGRDDYWGQGDGFCDDRPAPDVSRSPFLD